MCNISAIRRVVLVTSVTLTVLVNNTFALPSQTTVMAMAGNYASTWNSMLFPISMTSNKLTYTDFQFEGSGSGAGMLSGGAGLRKTAATGRVNGAYLFYDRDRDNDKSYFSLFSPGIESLSSVWSFQANAYIPFGSKEAITSAGWAADFGDDQYVEVTGHDEYDRYLTNYDRLSYGSDVTLSYRVPQSNQWQVSMTPYTYRLKDENSMVGGRIKLDYQKSDALNLFLEDRYDNKNNNRVVAGVSYRFGGSSADHQNLMLSPVYRNLNLNTTQDGMALSHHARYGDLAISNSDIEFVEESTVTALASGSEDGTAENPYTDIDSAIAAAEDDGQIWIEGDASFTASSSIELTGTQLIEGRTDDFKLAAIDSDDQPTIYAEGIEMLDTNSLSNFILLAPDSASGSSGTKGIYITASGKESAVAEIDNMTIGTTTEDNSFDEGIELGAGVKATITDSTINNYTKTPAFWSQYWAGVYLGTGASVTIDNSAINTAAPEDFGYIFPIGLWGNEGSNIQLIDSTVTVAGNQLAFGAVIADADMTMKNSVINVSNTGSEDMGGEIVGVYDYSDSEEMSTLDIQNSTINVDAGDATGVGVVATNGLDTVILQHDVINVTGDEDVMGVVVSDVSEDSTIKADYVSFNISSEGEDRQADAFHIEEDEVDVDSLLEISNNSYNLDADTTNKIYIDS